MRKALLTVRMGVAYFLGGIATGILGITAMILAFINPRMHLITLVMRVWGRVVLFLVGIRVDVEGAELLDPKGSYVLVSNHQSAIDPPLHLAYLPVSVRFLTKKELFKIPIFGQAMRAVGMVEIDRTAHGAALRSINRQVTRVMDMEASVIVYPEGTRTADGELRPFKKGAFRIAVDNGLPVVALTLHKAFDVWPPTSHICIGGRVKMVIHEPIPTEGLGRADLDDLSDRTRSVIGATLDRLRGEA